MHRMPQVLLYAVFWQSVGLGMTTSCVSFAPRLERCECGDGKVCELVEDGEPACFAPVEIRGQVFDLTDKSGVEGAHVVALDHNGTAVTTFAVTDTAGNYRLAVPSTRYADGTPIPAEMTLHVDAASHQSFPSSVRLASPIDSGIATPDGDTWVVASALTDVGLLALPSGSGNSSITGSVELPETRTGILMVATSSEGVGFASIADRDGEFHILNLPAGSYTVEAYAHGVSYKNASLALATVSDAKVYLALSNVATGTVSGTIQLVNAPATAMTSVILAVESTFDESLARGETVPGLRAPEPGLGCPPLALG